MGWYIPWYITLPFFQILAFFKFYHFNFSTFQILPFFSFFQIFSKFRWYIPLYHRVNGIYCLGYQQTFTDCAKGVLSRGSGTDGNDGPSFSRLEVRRC